MNLDDASEFHKSSTSRLYPLTLRRLRKIPMSKSKPKTRVSSPGSRVTRSSATNKTSNVSEIAVTSSTHPEPRPRKKKKNNQALPVTTSFQDPFDEPNNSPPPMVQHWRIELETFARLALCAFGQLLLFASYRQQDVVSRQSIYTRHSQAFF